MSWSPDSEIEAILAGDLERVLPHDVREVLLDVILSWAELDMSSAFFVSSVSGFNPTEGADKFGRKVIEQKLQRASLILQNEGKEDIAAEILKISNAYPAKAFFRRRIAHSRCAGVRKSMPDRIVFLPFEREGLPGNLAIEVIDISAFIDAKNWAREVHSFLMKQVDDVDFFKRG